MMEGFPPDALDYLMKPSRFDAIAFDLLTALIDSWSLWIAVAGDEERGRAWRRASLARVTTSGAYRPYEVIVQESAGEVGIPASKADELLARWPELQPWPEARGVLQRLRGWRLAIVTNCSQRLAEIAAKSTGCDFEVIVSAERSGYYKIAPEAYRAALDALELPPERVLFVAGSPHDVPGASAVGMPVYWVNRAGAPVPAAAPAPIGVAADLRQLPEIACLPPAGC